MMTKTLEIEKHDSTFNRTAPDEPVFLICGRDRLAPAAVEEWAKLAEANGVGEHKVARARSQAAAMRIWQEQTGIVRLPD